MADPINVRLILTLRQAEALLAICHEAEAGGYMEGELFNQDTRQINSANTAIARLASAVNMGQKKERGLMT